VAVGHCPLRQVQFLVLDTERILEIIRNLAASALLFDILNVMRCDDSDCF
jgi:hypothetical protein